MWLWYIYHFASQFSHSCRFYLLFLSSSSSSSSSAASSCSSSSPSSHQHLLIIIINFFSFRLFFRANAVMFYCNLMGKHFLLHGKADDVTGRTHSQTVEQTAQVAGRQSVDRVSYSISFIHPLVHYVCNDIFLLSYDLKKYEWIVNWICLKWFRTDIHPCLKGVLAIKLEHIS